MRSYSDREIKRIISRAPLIVGGEQDLSSSGPRWWPHSSAAAEPFDLVQFIADLEFERKFEMLLRSIALRGPLL